MVEQKPIDYWQIFAHLMQRRSELIRQRDEADVELAKMKQMILSVFAMLSEDQQKANQQAIDDVKAESAGIQDAIKTVFSLHPGVWMTASDVRERLGATGFDFRDYKANPLSSISTTLKRLGDTGYLEVKPVAPGMVTATLYLRNDPARKFTLADLSGDDPIRKLAEGSALDRFKRAHDAKLAQERAAKEMRDAGSEVGVSLSIDNAHERSQRGKK